MYQIYADDTLIYDSTLEDYKIGGGQITKELDKSGSFVFSLYPDHPYYNSFVKLRTVVTVKKSGRIVFRGRVLNDTTDYWNTGTFTCEGELGFLRDSVIRPFEFQGKPADLFKKFVNEHNAQVDEFKRFKLGSVTVEDSNDYINRSTYGYPTALDVLKSALTGSGLGGHIYVTHGDDGTDPVPTIHYVADFPKTATQSIEFGVNLRNYAKTATAEAVATAIIPLGTETETTGQRLTIERVNDGKDYIYSEAGVALYGWVVKTVVWEDVTIDSNLKTKAEAYLDAAVNQNITVELNAIDLHLLDRSIESINVCEYVQVSSAPHGFNAVLLCNKQTLDLLNPERDTVVLGYHVATFTQASTDMAYSVSTLGKTISTIRQDAQNIHLSVEEVEKSMAAIELSTGELRLYVQATEDELNERMSSIELGTGNLSLSVTNSTTSASIQLMVGDEKLGTPATIQMTGLVTFSGLKDGTTVIDGGCIQTGTISADRIDASELVVDAGHITGTLKVGALPSSVAMDSEVTTITQNAISTAYISAYQITAGVLDADDITLSSGYGGFGIAYGSYDDGYGNVSTTYGAKVYGSSSYNYLIVTNSGVRLQSSYANFFVSGSYIKASTTIEVSSDRRAKQDITYDVAKYRAFLRKLKPSLYRYKSDPAAPLNCGFIAQDVEEALAETGLTRLDFDGVRGGELDEGTGEPAAYGLAYTQFIALLTDAVQDIYSRLETVENHMGG